MKKRELKKLAAATKELLNADYIEQSDEFYTFYVRDYHENFSVNYAVINCAENELECDEDLKSVVLAAKFKVIVFEVDKEQKETLCADLDEVNTVINACAALNFTDEELREHYRALIDEDCENMTRDELIEALRDTEFEEHAYII